MGEERAGDAGVEQAAGIARPGSTRPRGGRRARPRGAGRPRRACRRRRRRPCDGKRRLERLGPVELAPVELGSGGREAAGERRWGGREEVLLALEDGQGGRGRGEGKGEGLHARVGKGRRSVCPLAEGRERKEVGWLAVGKVKGGLRRRAFEPRGGARVVGTRACVHPAAVYRCLASGGDPTLPPSGSSLAAGRSREAVELGSVMLCARPPLRKAAWATSCLPYLVSAHVGWAVGSGRGPRGYCATGCVPLAGKLRPPSPTP